MEKRLLAVGGVMGVGLVLVRGRLVQLTVLEGEYLASQAAAQHQQRLTLTPRRGAIVDRNNVPLALSLPVESLFVRPRKLPADVGAQVPALAAALRVSTQAVDRLLHAPAPFVWLKRRATPEEAAQVRGLDIAGIDSVETQRRVFPQRALARAPLWVAVVHAPGCAGGVRGSGGPLRGGPAVD